jgi:hypothetical protein
VFAAGDPNVWKKCFQSRRKRAYIFPMFGKVIALILIAVALAGCSTPTYEDGTKKEYSDMPWNTPARWEGSMNVPGMSDYR